ncbi:hypothetical protein VTJ83DRAFT_1815 [Remersonia thermophila]|uniref:Uncharacterized protein n=1 Tax=Remersonia thermophila TaxID=72144 RepID=A0ABR4DIH3_9PEZI
MPRIRRAPTALSAFKSQDDEQNPQIPSGVPTIRVRCYHRHGTPCASQPAKNLHSAEEKSRRVPSKHLFSDPPPKPTVRTNQPASKFIHPIGSLTADPSTRQHKPAHPCFARLNSSPLTRPRPPC